MLAECTFEDQHKIVVRDRPDWCTDAWLQNFIHALPAPVQAPAPPVHAPPPPGLTSAQMKVKVKNKWLTLNRERLEAACEKSIVGWKDKCYKEKEKIWRRRGCEEFILLREDNHQVQHCAWLVNHTSKRRFCDVTGRFVCAGVIAEEDIMLQDCREDYTPSRKKMKASDSTPSKVAMAFAQNVSQAMSEMPPPAQRCLKEAFADAVHAGGGNWATGKRMGAENLRSVD